MPFDFVAHVAEGHIQEAIEQGKLDNLPGQGKPLNLVEDATLPSHVRIANRVLGNAGIAPEWIQNRQQVLDERVATENALQKAIRENRSRTARLHALLEDATAKQSEAYMSAYADWHAVARRNYLEQLKSVNTAILKYCMTAPTTAEPFTPYNISTEMSRYDEFVPGPDASPDAALLPVQSAAKNGTLRIAARFLYQRLSGE